MKALKHFFFIFIILIAASTITNAQDDIPVDDEVPVDGGISLLLAAGAIWGVKKLKEKN